MGRYLRIVITNLEISKYCLVSEGSYIGQKRPVSILSNMTFYIEAYYLVEMKEGALM